MVKGNSGLILCIETSALNCSVALSLNNACIALKEQRSEHFTHAEALHVFIQELLLQSHHSLQELDAVVISKGPGSYTGLRIGVSTAKGLCFALGIPLYSISTLDILAGWAAEQSFGTDQLVPCIDARRMEVYCGKYNSTGELQGSISARIMDEMSILEFESDAVFFGDGADKLAALLTSNQRVIPGVFPGAAMMCSLTHRFELEDVAYFEPFYLKDFIPGIRKKSEL